jgi:L-lactate dehydrogenase (cytochrome)
MAMTSYVPTLDQVSDTLQKAWAAAPSWRRRSLARSVLNLDDFQMAARKRLPSAIYGYVANGSEDSTSLETNRRAFLEYRLVPRVLVGLPKRDQRVSLFGSQYAAPFGIAPMGGSAAVTYDADNVMARAASKHRIPFVLSGNSITPMEEVAGHYPGAWFAAYQSPDAEAIDGMVDRVAAAGFSVFVLTADVPVGSNREGDVRAGFSQPIRLNAKLIRDGLKHPGWLVSTAGRTLLQRGLPHIDNLEPTGGPNLFSRSVSKIASHTTLAWEHVRRIRQRWKGPLVIKGILSREDACIARDCGANGVVVSNHGGRQLDKAVTPLQVLAEIVNEAHDMPVIIDSGFRRGTDILMALALGAKFVLVGRPFLFAASVAGEVGVAHGIELLQKEIDTDMALLGAERIEDISSDMLRPSSIDPPDAPAKVDAHRI